MYSSWMPHLSGHGNYDHPIAFVNKKNKTKKKSKKKKIATTKRNNYNNLNRSKSVK